MQFKSRAFIGRLALAVLSTLGATLIVVPSSAHAATSYKILITGDSITQGSSGDYTWRYRLWNKLQSTEVDPVSFVGTRTDLYDNVNDTQGSQYYAASFAGKAHSAKWGDAFTLELGNISAQVTTTGANVLVVMLGSNDLAYLTSPEDTIANLKTYIARARQAAPGIDIVVGQVVNRWDPWSQSYILNSETSAYASLLQTAASELNTSSQRVVVAPTMTGWDPKIHTWDGTHPNPTGEALIAQRVSQALATIGVGASSPDISGTKSWNVAGSSVGLQSGSEQASLSWNRTPSGATGMFIETRLSNIAEAWHRLPYAVSGNGWTAGLLAAGGTYEFRVVPSKGFSTGIAGPASSVVVGGPMPSALSSVSAVAGGDYIYGGKTAHVDWPTSTNASGYFLSSRMMSNGTLTYDDLPYPIPDTDWIFTMMYPGRWYQYRIKPVRGYLSPGWKSSSSIRMQGVPADRVYTALGDSYSSGLGSVSLSSYTGGSCYRTTEAWAYSMQSSFQYKTAHLACAGAVTATVRNTQIDQMNSTFANSPGKPQLVTMTIGGNDVGFGDLAHDCVIGAGSCTQYRYGTELSIDNLEPTLRSLYASIKSAQPYADILVGGYPAVVEPGSSGGWPNLCDAFGNDERDMADDLVIRLNSRIASAASDANVWSVGQGVHSEFLGHGGCSTDEWINGPIRDGVGVSTNSFHPSIAGQIAYAFAFSDALIARAGQ